MEQANRLLLDLRQGAEFCYVNHLGKNFFQLFSSKPLDKFPIICYNTIVPNEEQESEVINMLVKCRVRKYETMYVEIPDEFRKLATPHPWNDPNISNEDYDHCIDAIEKLTGIPVDDDPEKDIVIESVWSAENGEMILEM